MTQAVPMEMNFLAAMLHGRRSRLAEKERLDPLCRIRSIEELGRVLYPQDTYASAIELQRRMVRDYFEEFARLAGGAEERPQGLLTWLPVRMQVENLKVVVRGWTSHTPLEEIQNHLVPLPGKFAVDAQQLLTSESADVFVAGLPNHRLRMGAERLSDLCKEPPGSFFFEAVLDHAYLQELATRAEELDGDDAQVARVAIHQEIDLFHLMLAVRGRWIYDLKPESLLRLHVSGSKLSSGRFRTWLTAASLEETAALAVGTALDEVPASGEPADIETQAWNRLLRLANRAFRQGHMSMGAVVGYAVIRRIELANLITLCEGIRAGMPPAELRACMLPCLPKEGGHV